MMTKNLVSFQNKFRRNKKRAMVAAMIIFFQDHDDEESLISKASSPDSTVCGAGLGVAPLGECLGIC